MPRLAADRPLRAGSAVRALALVLALAAPSAGGAADGELDPDFFGDGVASYATGGDSFALWAAVSAPDGALVVAGRRTYEFALGSAAHWRRLTDSTLGPPCDLEPAGWTNAGATAAAFDLSGRLLLAGIVTQGPQSQLFVARYLYPDCTLDTEFGTDGFVTHALTGPTYFRAFAIASRLVTTVPPLFVERILVLGSSFAGSDTHGRMVRLTGSGALDGAWGTGGIVPVPVSPGHVLGAALAGSGALFVGARNGEFWVTRRLSTGAVDPAFGDLGVVEIPIDAVSAGADAARAVAAYPDGRLLVAGECEVASSSGAGGEAPAGATPTVAALVRLLADGDLDTTFGATGPTPGIVRYGFGSPNPYLIRVSDVALQGDGRLLFAASAPSSAQSDTAVFVARAHANGGYDTSFAGDGVALLDLDVAGAAAEFPIDLMLRAGRPIVAGQADAPPGSPSHAFALRLESSYLFADGFESGSTQAWSGQ